VSVGKSVFVQPVLPLTMREDAWFVSYGRVMLRGCDSQRIAWVGSTMEKLSSVCSYRGCFRVGNNFTFFYGRIFDNAIRNQIFEFAYKKQKLLVKLTNFLLIFFWWKNWALYVRTAGVFVWVIILLFSMDASLIQLSGTKYLNLLTKTKITRETNKFSFNFFFLYKEWIFKDDLICLNKYYYYDTSSYIVFFSFYKSIDLKCSAVSKCIAQIPVYSNSSTSNRQVFSNSLYLAWHLQSLEASLCTNRTGS